ncbi:MAG: class D sortase [Lachnospiraceae bacterium]|nr:class D sortase [Lachnospiraceae bacterium]
MIRKILAAIFIMAGLAAMSVPFFYYFYGNQKSAELIKQFEQSAEQAYRKDGKKEEKRENEAEDECAKIPGHFKDVSLLSSGDVIGLIEIEALDLKYPIVEGTDSKQLAHGIGHIPNTAAIGEKGNCVLAGHRGSRYGAYFKYLNRLSQGNIIKITDKEGNVYQYEVISWEVVEPYDNSVKAQGEEKKLTLITCENSGTMRLVYHCACKG